MIATFPNYMQVLFDGYSESMLPNLIRTEMESGPLKQRSTQCRVIKQVKIKYNVCSTETYKEFLAWYRNEIGNGSGAFYWTDPLDETIKRARIIGGGLQSRPVNYLGSAWEIDLNLEVWDG